MNYSIPLQPAILKSKKNTSYTSQIALHNPLISNKIIKKGLFIASANIPQNMKDCLIHNLLTDNNQDISFNQYMIQNMNQKSNINMNTSYIDNSNVKNHVNMARHSNNQRILFTKDEDKKIKQLVEIFGTKHWDLVAQFMNGRTAKQCRDRYSNYLIPGYFQGDWTAEEDSLLIKLYIENGPKWSIIQKSFPQRSANTIKNRWYYFLRKRNQIFSQTKKNKQKYSKSKPEMKQSAIINGKNDLSNPEENQSKINFGNVKEENEKCGNELSLFDQENEIFDLFDNNIDEEDGWLQYF